MGLGTIASVALIFAGVLAAIFSLPSIVNSVLLFILIGGAGVLIGYKMKSLRASLLWGLGLFAWFYAFIEASMNWWMFNNSALVFDSLKIAVPVAVLGTLVFGWLGPKKLAPEERHKTWSVFFGVAFFALLIVTPFAVGGVLDYNWRGDTSPPRVMQLTVVDKWRQWQYDSEGGSYMYYLKGETLDGSRQFSLWVLESHYNEHDIGSLCEIKVHKGALGYEWFMAPLTND